MRITIGCGGIGTPLFLVFLVLKLCGVIGWSWWWVTCPLWIPVAILLLAVLWAICVAVLVMAATD